MTTAVLPFRSADSIEPSALDQVLRAAGALSEGRVQAVTAVPIGTGQMAQSVRLAVTYDGPSDGPPTLVAKFPSADDRSRSVGRAMRAYEIEVGFYRELAPSTAVRVPTCHLAAIDLDTHDFVLLLEDLAPAEQGDQLDGCTPEFAARVLEQAVAYHAPAWGDRALEEVGWLNRSTPRRASRTATMVTSLYPGFLDRFGALLDDDVLRGLEVAMAHVDTWWQGAAGPRTLLHGDLRLDNLLIGDGPDDLWVVDWQTLVLGNGVADVSYFIGGNLLTGVRRDVEVDLVRGYHERLRAAGVDGCPWDECWRLYRHGAWHGVFLTVAASMLVEQTDRGDRMFTTDLDRHVRHAMDLDTVAVVGDGRA